MPRQRIKGEREESNAYSRSVITTGGKAIWMAGVGAPFKGTRHVFKQMLHADERFGMMIVSQEKDLVDWLDENK